MPLSDAACAARWAHERLAAAHAEFDPRLPIARSAAGEWTIVVDHGRCARLWADIERWALRVGLYEPGRDRGLVQAPMTELSAAVLPTASTDLVRAATMYWTVVVAFDDQVVETGRSPAPYAASVGPILLEGRLPAEPDRFHHAYLDVHRELVAAGAGPAMPEFTRQAVRALEGYVEESGWRRTGRLPVFAEYLRNGLSSAQMLPYMALQRLRPGLVPPDAPWPPQIAQLARLSCLVTRLENDLLGITRDDPDGGLNACWAAARDYGISPYEAAPAVLAARTAMRAEHDALLADIRRDPSQVACRAQAEAIGGWTDVCYAWFLSVARYRD
ncbi:terpene synthase family protein [Streptomyces sp. CA-249302]|uniref:terpene synthase family protein n=1 Tax=Streptomyces sp. CA-249302 TaxID=3240058 RepID=UPI003D8F798A